MHHLVLLFFFRIVRPRMATGPVVQGNDYNHIQLSADGLFRALSNFRSVKIETFSQYWDIFRLTPVYLIIVYHVGVDVCIYSTCGCCCFIVKWILMLIMYKRSELVHFYGV